MVQDFDAPANVPRLVPRLRLGFKSLTYTSGSNPGTQLGRDDPAPRRLGSSPINRSASNVVVQ